MKSVHFRLLWAAFYPFLGHRNLLLTWTSNRNFCLTKCLIELLFLVLISNRKSCFSNKYPIKKLFLRDDIQQKKIYFKWALPLKPRPPPPSPKRARWSFFRPPKRHYSAYCRIKFKLILIMKMMISVMKMVIVLMIMVMRMTKKQTNTMGF